VCDARESLAWPAHYDITGNDVRMVHPKTMQMMNLGAPNNNVCDARVSKCKAHESEARYGAKQQMTHNTMCACLPVLLRFGPAGGRIRRQRQSWQLMKRV
jgi:hypothetical protein